MLRYPAMEGRLFLVDGTALAYRAHFAFIGNPLTTSRGQPTSAAYGYISDILRLLREERPDFMAVAFDRPEPTFRKKQYPDYKATREKAPDDMVAQLPAIKEVTEALGIPVLERAGYEADDLIGTAARLAEERGLEVLIVSGDKDMMQLVTARVRIYDLSRRAGPGVIDADGVRRRFGVALGRVVDVMGLMGDTSDNVPGVPLIGPKKATALVQKWGSLEEVLAHAAEGKPSKTRRNLIEFADQARLSKELVTIRTDVPVEICFDRLHPGARDRDRLVKLFGELEFAQLLPQVVGEGAEEASTRGYRIVRTAAEIDALAADLKRARFFVFDTETTGLDPFGADLVGIAFCWKKGEASYVPCEDAAAVLERLRPVLEDPELRKGGQNLKYDAQVLRTHGVEVRNLAFDTMIASYLLDPGRGVHNLDLLALRHLNIRKTPIGDLIGKGRDQITMAEVPVER
ncbi:MAG: 5'-3' exonuclease H3TH domain-containing protein, partial [Planctomycetota bacterium]